MIHLSTQSRRQVLVGLERKATAALRQLATPAVFAVLAVAIGMSPAHAGTSVFTHGATTLVAQQGDIGPSAAAAAASAASGGQVLDVKSQRSRTGVIYRVKVLLPGGRVRSVTVDGQTGQVLG